MSYSQDRQNPNKADLRLYYDILKGNTAAVQKFIDKGGDVNAVLQVDCLPYPGVFDGVLYRTLNYSIQQLHSKLHGYSWPRSITPLALAAFVGKSDIASLLMKANADPTIQTRGGETAADLTPHSNTLLKGGLQAYEFDYIAKNTPEKLPSYKTQVANNKLARAVFSRWDEQAARAALADGANILNDSDNRNYRGGEPILLTAIYGGYLAGLAVMLETKPDLNATYGKQNYAPIDLIYRLETLEMLVAAGMDINRPLQSGRSLLGQMLHVGEDDSSYDPQKKSYYAKVITALTSKGYDINTPNKNGDTCLMIALRKRKDIVAQALLQCGADPSIRNPRGESAYTIAEQRTPNNDVISGLQTQYKAVKEESASAKAAKLEKENKALHARLKRMEKTLTDIKAQMAEMGGTAPAANQNTAAPKAKVSKRPPAP